MAKEKSNIAIEQGLRLKQFRESLNMDQPELAKLLSLHQSSISKYESGVVFLPPRAVKLLHKSHKLSYDFFYAGKLPMRTAEVKETTFTNIADLKQENRHLEYRVHTLEETVKMLVKEVYAMKHAVEH